MDAATRELASSKRRPQNRLGWAVQWGTVRMLGTFLTEDPAAVPDVVVEFVADQLDIFDTACFKALRGQVADRLRARMGHPGEVRLPGFR